MGTLPRAGGPAAGSPLRLPLTDLVDAVTSGRLCLVDHARACVAQALAVEPRIHDGVFGVLTVAASVASRTSFGGTAPANVAAMAAEWRARLA